jgi:hypothetical protein
MESLVTLLTPHKLDALLQKFSHGFGYSGEVRDKLTVIAC